MGRSEPAEAAEAVAELIASLDVPYRLRDVGVDSSAYPAIAKATLGDVVSRESPVPVTEAAIVELLEQAW
jgi:alcohol dehydrogenase class IV